MTQRLSSLLAAALIAVGGCAADPPGSKWTPPDQSNAISAGADGNGLPQIHTDGRHFKDPAGNVVIMRGVDLIDIAQQDGDAVMPTSALLDLLSDSSQGWYARIVRLAVSPQGWKKDPDAYFNNHLKPDVDYATQRGLYVIIDWHYVTTLDPATRPDVGPTTEAFWKYVAPKFATYTNVWYEIFNEVDNTFSSAWQDYQYYIQPWVDIVRTHARDNLILVGGPTWDQNLGPAVTDPMHGDNIGYVAHIYPEHDHSLWSATSGISSLAKVRPLIITEWGFRADPDVPTKPDTPCRGTQADFGNSFKAWVEASGISWTAWVASNNWEPAMFNRDWTLRVSPNDMGGFVKDWLAEKKDLDQVAR